MRNIKKYKIFLESFDSKLGERENYSIYEWVEDLKSHQWRNNSCKKSVNKDSLKRWTEHFIGDGYYDKISTHVNNISKAFDKVDLEEIRYRMYDVFDNYLFTERSCEFGIIYGDYYKEDGYFNGMLFSKEFDFINTYIEIAKNIVFPTLKIGDIRDDIWLRESSEKKYVTDKKYQCVNFNIDDYDIDATSYTSLWGYKDKKKYSVDRVIQFYQPAICIRVGGNWSMRGGKFNLEQIEKDLDETLPMILPTIDYKKVIWDMNKGDRRYSSDMDIDEYTLKIWLNM
jgi:hypothetical protein